MNWRGGVYGRAGRHPRAGGVARRRLGGRHLARGELLGVVDGGEGARHLGVHDRPDKERQQRVRTDGPRIDPCGACGRGVEQLHRPVHGEKQVGGHDHVAKLAECRRRRRDCAWRPAWGAVGRGGGGRLIGDKLGRHAEVLPRGAARGGEGR